MKYIRFISPTPGNPATHGILKEGMVHVVRRSILESGPEFTGETVSLGEIRTFLPPMDPPNIVALGLNYADHAKESDTALPKAPIIFLKATTALCAHKDPIILPAEAPGEVDYEAELAVIIGKTAKNVPPEKVHEVILGYSCANDVSARDCQFKHDKQWARAKSFDTFAPLGPVMETVLDTRSLSIRSILNGRVMQDDSTAHLIFPVSAIVSYLSRQMTLLPGTVIMTGTPAGVGFVRKPPVFLKPGDTISVEIEGIGVLTNPVVEQV